MIEYAAVPSCFNISIIKPLVKDDKLPTDTVNNLRPIAVSDIYSTLFEKVLLNEIKKQPSSTEHDKQFGFKPNSSCAHAVFVLKQVILICKHSKKRMYIIAIDLTKAFDKVHRPLLWLNMFKRGINPQIILVFMGYYELSMALVELDGERTEIFKINTGVKQGGPALFNFIAHFMIICIESLNIGVYIGKELINIIVYAFNCSISSRAEANGICLGKIHKRERT